MGSILIVDDDAIFRRALQRRLPGETRCAANIRDGILAAADCHPTVILLDLYYENECALDSLPQFIAAAPRAELIVMSALYEKWIADMAVAMGAFAFIEKTNLSELCALVQDARLLSTTVLVSPSVQLLH